MTYLTRTLEIYLPICIAIIVLSSVAKVNGDTKVIAESNPLRSKRSGRGLLLGGSKCFFSVVEPGKFGIFSCRPFRRCPASKRPCPIWTKWHGQELCSTTCGQGFRIERRYCQHKRPNRNCQGNSTRSVPCNQQACPTWSSWTVTSDCNETCRIGRQVISRTCLLDSINSTGCEGPRDDVVACENNEPCGPHWSSWSRFGPCSTICDEIGFKTRTRLCLNAVNNNASDCRGTAQETQICLDGVIGLSCANRYGEWSSWSQCDAVCGSWTIIQRNRSCLSNNCDQEFLKDFKLCVSAVCQEELNISNSLLNLNTSTNNHVGDSWTEWSSCVRHLRNEIQLRGRNCSVSSANNLICQFENSEIRNCNIPRVDWESWKPWSSCTGSCGRKQGIKLRRRRCTKTFGLPARFRNVGLVPNRIDEEISAELCDGGHSASYEVSVCMTEPCPSRWSTWSSWSACSSSCGSGYAQSTRICIQNLNSISTPCVGQSTKYKRCISPPCWTAWTTFKPCTASCGELGVQNWTRRCEGTSSQFETCSGVDFSLRRCNTQVCPLWGPWSNFTPCSETCGEGEKSKTRRCLSGKCEGRRILRERCNIRDCPQWSSWSLYSCCSTTCGVGVKTRSRTCSNFVPQIAECNGSAVEETACNAGPCNVSSSEPQSVFVCGNTTALKAKKSAFLKIFGGKTSQIEKWPWQVSLQRNWCTSNPEPCWNHICGGTLIAPRWVVSAAHCTKLSLAQTIRHDDPSNDVSIVMGISNIHVRPNNHRMLVRRIIVHPNYTYDGINLINDIELIKLEQPANVLPTTVMPACLPTSSPLADETVCYATGWGYTENSNQVSSVLREGIIPIVGFERCKRLGKAFQYLNERFHLCAGNPETGGPDTCQGDSGGPLVCKNGNNLWFLAGVTSFGMGARCGLPNFVGIYTPVHNYLSWIEQTITLYSHPGC